MPTADPVLEGFLARVPQALRDSFTSLQLAALKGAFGAESRGAHPVDLRLSLPLLFGHRRIYCVIVAGRDRRRQASRFARRVLRALRRVILVAAVLAMVVVAAALLVLQLY